MSQLSVYFKKTEIVLFLILKKRSTFWWVVFLGPVTYFQSTLYYFGNVNSVNVYVGNSICYECVEKSNKICLSIDCFDTWKKFNGKIEGYIFCTKRGCHKGVCIRQKDCEKNVLRIDLCFTEDKQQKKWMVKIISSDWQPKDCKIFTASGSWHLAMLVCALQQHAEIFGSWNMCCSNCNKINGLKALFQTRASTVH